MNTQQHLQGWDMLRKLNDGIGKLPSKELRRILASYMATNPQGPSKLHSAMLSVATRMATMYSDFHFVPFLNTWGLKNFREEDGEADIDASGKRFPSLLERLAKAYVYSLMLHPDERLASDAEAVLAPLIRRRGFSLPQPCVPMITTRIFTSEVRGRKITFVCLVAADGTEVATEVHTLTAFCRMPYADIPNRLFRVLLRTVCNESGQTSYKVESAILESRPISDFFPLSIGYVEHFDAGHDHIHIFDNHSRHFVAVKSDIHPSVGQYVGFVPLIPRNSRFKSAIIYKVYSHEEGTQLFGCRMARITRVSASPQYCAWELIDGTPLVEEGTPEPSFTMGYLSEQLLQARQIVPPVGSDVGLIVFLKRGKDGKKRPYVVDFEVVPAGSTPSQWSCRQALLSHDE
ncbi:MAG: hypothetical protein Q4E55_00480 [Bacteroidales bacterium]|nr:hypothetical protein [Bacteroidales bacterium]